LNEIVPAPVRLFVGAVLLDLVLLAVYRCLFLMRFRRAAPDADRAELLRAFGIGLRFDLRLSILIALPILALAWIPGTMPAASPAAARTWWAWLSGAFAFVTLVHLVDAEHYDYLGRRIDATVVEHLAAPGIAIRAVWEGFPVLRGIGAFALATGLHSWLTKTIVLDPAAALTLPPGPGWRAASWGAAGAASLAGLYGRVAWFPLRWSDAFFSTSPFVAALGLNPVLFIFSTWDNRRASADRDLVRASYGEVARVIGVGEPDAERLRFSRQVPARSRPPIRPNIVIVVLESFAGFKVGALGNRLSPTPRFDALAARSHLFTNFFAVTGPTARAVFTLLTGIPDVNAVHSASRNPLAVRQRSLVNAFEGYEKMYLIGGSASWGNIRGVLSHNIRGIRIHEEGDFDAPRNDGWGISDLDLLTSANRLFRAQEKPFVSFVHLAGNHRPWTIPRDSRGFEHARAEQGLLQENGFGSLAEFNSFRFMDHALGCFFEEAGREEYYGRTLFFLLADHGNPTPRQTAWERLGLTHVHTPLLVHGPAILGPARRIDTVMSSVDVLPTAAGLAGLRYENTTLGRDFFDPRPDSERFAFVSVFPRFGLVGSELFFTLGPRGRRGLYAYRSDPPEEVGDRYPEEARRMEGLCRGYLETARFLLRRGREDETAPGGAS
jgi:phosphoglycerol transferase MdoB-like AlkP superfamily enzyme